ncbi:thioredoxin [Halocola ammonii]
MKSNFSEIIKGDKPVLIDFYADWCQPCKMQAPILKELKSKLGDDVKIVKIDTEKNQQLAVKYQVRSIPTLMIFMNGEVKWRKSGVAQAGELEQVINGLKSEAQG